MLRCERKLPEYPLPRIYLQMLLLYSMDCCYESIVAVLYKQ